MKGYKNGYSALGIAVIKRAIKDCGAEYLKTESAEFYKLLSDTDDNDYEKNVEQYNKRQQKKVLTSKNKSVTI